MATAALPYLSRWLQRAIRITIVLLALATIVSAVRAAASPCWPAWPSGVLLTAVVHLVFGSPLGLVSAAEVDGS